MARYTGPASRVCRRLGECICNKKKCTIGKRAFPPGQHGQNRIKMTDYGIQLREKQKVKKMYGLVEKQFRVTFDKASRAKGVTGEKLLELLERRLDNVVFRLGFASTRRQARQWVGHGHVKVNGRKVGVPSYAVRVNDVVEIKDNTVSRQMATKNLEISTSRAVPDWLLLNKEAFKGTVLRIPSRDEIQPIANEQAVVEFYSR